MSAKYSDDTRAQVLAFYAASGNLSKTSKVYGIPHQTIFEWTKGEGVNPDVAEKAAEKKGEMADACEKIAWLILGTIDEYAIKDAPLHSRTTAFGTLVDKMRLLRGEPTNAENRTIRVEYADASPAETP